MDELVSSKSTWVIAAITAVSMHIALAAIAYAHMQADIEQAELGAPGIEISLDIAAPRTPPSELPPGPDSDALVATPPIVRQDAVKKDRDLPKETPVEAENPDRLVTLQSPKRPSEEDPDVKPQVTAPSDASIATEAMAAPSLEAVPEAAKSTTRDLGIGQSKQRVRVTWQRELAAHLDRHKRYPSERTQQNAEVVVNLVLDRLGKVVSVSIARGSGDPAFDEAALAMVRRADPVPPPPSLVADDGLSFTLPVLFRNRGRS